MEGVAILGVDGYGARAAWCVGLDTGMEVQAEESESRNASTMYPRRVTSTSFTISLSFRSEREWREFNEWLEVYARRVGSGRSGPMVVSIPTRSFVRRGIPTVGFEYGSETGVVVHRLTLKFEGIGSRESASREPDLPNDSTVQQFYPTGNQLSAADRAEAVLYDDIDGGSNLTRPENSLLTNAMKAMRAGAS